MTKIDTNLGRPVRNNQKLLTVRHTDPVYRYAPVIVRAPVTGVVSNLDVTIGSRVVKGQKLGVVTDPNAISIVLELAAADLSAVNPGLEGELLLVGQTTRLPVIVLGVSPFVDPGTGTATCELAMAKRKSDPAKLPPGLMGKVTFHVRERHGYEIPEYAVIYRGKDAFIKVVENDKAKLLPVVLGAMRRGAVEILSGLKEGVPVILRSSVFVAEGESVNVQAADTGKFE